MKGKEIYSFSEPLLNKTNNEAEYTTLLKGIQTILELKLVNIIICSDNELIVNQIKENYKTKNDRISTNDGSKVLIIAIRFAPILFKEYKKRRSATPIPRHPLIISL